MSDYAQPHRRPAAEVAENTMPSHTKLWIVLGSIIGVLVIVMGGCVACGALIGFSALNDGDDSGRHGKNVGKNGAGALATTSWKGTLSCDDGDNLPVVIKFAGSGNPLYDYQTSSGLKELELTSPGQTLRFVPPGGGVTNIVLDSISVSAERMRYVMSVSQERSGGGTLIQSRAQITTEAVISGSTLQVETTIRSNSTASQPGFVIPGQSTTVCRGSLTR